MLQEYSPRNEPGAGLGSRGKGDIEEKLRDLLRGVKRMCF
jgi:hypothetical protein